MEKILEVIEEFWRRHVCGDFPSYYTPECFMCNKVDCKDCPSIGFKN